MIKKEDEDILEGNVEQHRREVLEDSVKVMEEFGRMSDLFAELIQDAKSSRNKHVVLPEYLKGYSTLLKARLQSGERRLDLANNLLDGGDKSEAEEFSPIAFMQSLKEVSEGRKNGRK